MTRPGQSPGKAATAATAATLRRAVLGPYDVIVLAAAEAVGHEPGRQVPPDVEEIRRAAQVTAQQARACLAVLSRQRLVSGDGEFFALTPLGVEVLGELIRRETRRGARRR